ncbi:MAG: hypothetical protein CR997_04440 [Acidobacteria bacterium]|nr:MAG: hypothetical protein CR997_04440 [Acidobacteriota bacterium]
MTQFGRTLTILTAMVLYFAFAGMCSAGENGPSILVTDVGQGNNAKIIRMLMKKNKIANIKFKEVATEADLEGVGTVIVGVGASTKGLGAAGLDLDKEMARAKKLLDKAKSQSIKIIGVHIGGPARRGELSDTLNELVVKSADQFIVWEDGNKDAFFTKLAKSKLGDQASDEDLASVFRTVKSKRDVGSAIKETIGQ